MLGLTDNGHIVHAQALATQTFYLAWGGLPVNYPEVWTINQTPPISTSQLVTETVTRVSVGLIDVLANTGVMYAISVAVGSTIYRPTIDYLVVANTIVWQPGGNSPTIATTYTVIYRITTAAITSLLNEYGRLLATTVGYVNPNSLGTIVANNATWSISESPTSNLYLNFTFDPLAASGDIIYQVGIFVGTVPNLDVPPGQFYLAPTDILTPGTLYMLDNVVPFARYAGKREIFEVIISF